MELKVNERLGLEGGEFPDSIETEKSVDPHFHLRNRAKDGDGRMEMVIAACEGEHERITGIGNSSPAILTGLDGVFYAKQAEEFRSRKNSRRKSQLHVSVSPLITDRTDPEVIIQIRKDPRIRERVPSVKVFFGGVSNDYGNNVTSIKGIANVLHAAADSQYGPPLPVTFHAERAVDRQGERLPLREREWYCVERDIAEVFQIEPEGIYVLRHASDGRTVQFVRHHRLRGIDVHVEIAPHYCLMTFEDLFAEQAFHGHWLYWPVAKDEWSRRIILDTALECPDWVHFATDGAIHIDDMTKPKNVKITCDGDVCGGLTLLPWVAKSLMISAFIRWNRADMLDNYLSRNARKLYGWNPASRRKVLYLRQRREVPEYVYGMDKDGNQIRARVFLGGQTLDPCYVRAA